ncbi:uncharacterized protein LOC135641520 [Musa acuminata AAA Group]|uniref:uncharacterized protein LOC135641520 n=1 Tax=Musa acuminata AAA Group TaxID=214697 RepID=UPI0031D4FE80
MDYMKFFVMKNFANLVIMSRIQYRMGDALSMTIFSTSSFNKLGVPPGAPPKQQPDYHRLDTLLSIDNQQAVQLQQQPLEESSASAARKFLIRLHDQQGYDSTPSYGTVDKLSQEGSASAYCAQSASTNTPISARYRSKPAALNRYGQTTQLIHPS